jgi:lysozyme family protein
MRRWQAWVAIVVGLWCIASVWLTEADSGDAANAIVPVKSSLPKEPPKMAQFEPAVAYILNNEKELEENSNDPGGITKWGITLRFIKGLSPAKRKEYGIYSDAPSPDDIRSLSVEQAKAIYKGEFWNHSLIEYIPNQELANYVFDTAVNMGISPAIKCLQRALWALSHDRKLLEDDGILGEVTLGYVRMYHALAILDVMRSERAGDYRLIASEHQDQRVNLDGWLNRAYGVSAHWSK